jgi:NADPH2:quinone reductase
LGATPAGCTATPVKRYVSKCINGKGFDVVYDTVGGATLEHLSTPCDAMADML